MLVNPQSVCPLAGQWHLLFSAKSKQKLPAAPFAFNGCALAIASLPQKPRPNLSEFNVSSQAPYIVLPKHLKKIRIA